MTIEQVVEEMRSCGWNARKADPGETVDISGWKFSPQILIEGDLHLKGEAAINPHGFSIYISGALSVTP